MPAVAKGYYDGTSIQASEKLDARKNPNAIKTIVAEYVETDKEPVVKSARGILAEYGKPTLWEQEEAAWENAVRDDYVPA